MLKIIKWTPKTAEEIKAELNEMGFENLPKAASNETYDAMFEQVDNDSEIADRVFDKVSDEYADNYEFHKDTYDEFVERWIEDQTKALHVE